MERERITLYEMWVGIILTNSLICLASVWFVPEPLKWGMGLLLGAVTAMVLSHHMMTSIRRSVSKGGDPRVFMGVNALIRVIIEIVVLVVAHFSPYTSIIACFIGIFTLKLAAYETPLIHNIALKMNIVTDPVYPPVEYDENGNLIEKEIDDILNGTEESNESEKADEKNDSSKKPEESSDLINNITNIL